MQRVTVTLDDDLMEALDRIIAARGYQNRSEAIRDLARAGIQQASVETGEAESCVATLTYVYDHAARALSQRLVNAFHDHHDLSLSSLHVHLDHRTCLEVSVLRGRTEAVRQLAEHVIAERGVRHGQLVLVPASLESEGHVHGDEGEDHPHLHIRPTS